MAATGHSINAQPGEFGNRYATTDSLWQQGCRLETWRSLSGNRRMVCARGCRPGCLRRTWLAVELRDIVELSRRQSSTARASRMSGFSFLEKKLRPGVRDMRQSARPFEPRNGISNFSLGGESPILGGITPDNSSPLSPHLSGPTICGCKARWWAGSGRGQLLWLGPRRVGRETAATSLGQLPFFIDFLKTSGLFDGSCRIARWRTRRPTRRRRAICWGRRCCRCWRAIGATPILRR